MSKPADLVRFAVNGSDVNASNISAPSSGLRDTGFPTDAILTSANLNYFLNGYYRWLQYLNAGAFSGASSFDNTLSVTGAATLLSTLAVTGNVTVGNNSNVTLQGTGVLKFGARELTMGPSSFAWAGNNAFKSPSGGSTSWSGFAAPPNDTLSGAVMLPTGTRITSVTYRYNKGGSATSATFSLSSFSTAGTLTTRDTFSDSTSGASFITTPRSAINYTIGSGEAVFIQVQSANTSLAFTHAVIAYDHP